MHMKWRSCTRGSGRMSDEIRECALAPAEMEQHGQFGSFTSPPVARCGTRRSPAAWLSVLPCQPGRPSNNRPPVRPVEGLAEVQEPDAPAAKREAEEDWG